MRHLHIVAAALLLVATSASAREDARARLHYLQYCSGCHAMDGSGSPEHGVPSMRGLLGEFVQLPGGREFIVQVPGVMNSPLNNAAIATLMNWLLPTVSGDTLPAGFAPYTEQEIARLRSSRPADIMGARETLVRRMKAASAR